MNRSKQTEVLGGIITTIILILLVFLSNVEIGKLTFFESIANTIVSPIQNMFISLKNKVGGHNEYFSNIDDLIIENNELKEKNRELEEKVRELEIIKADNETMQAYMNLSQKYAEYKTIPAYVINKDISNLSNNIVINVGSDDGVGVKMTVIADKGLVGHVISVTKNTAKVQVIIDPASTVSCSISTTEQSLICKGTIDNNQVLRASMIPTGAELIQGDSVSTSGIGGIYRKGIYIGNIKEIITTSNIIDRYAIVEPAVDFSKLNNVLVIAE
ncbi:MAG: rod shape-determining protein MreC [Clostridia bacterium]|nr:rod shape-determining protein MreC [Clostridia bacterium]